MSHGIFSLFADDNNKVNSFKSNKFVAVVREICVCSGPLVYVLGDKLIYQRKRGAKLQGCIT